MIHSTTGRQPLNKLVYLDTETTGLVQGHHQPWEVAYAVGDGPIRVLHLAHDPSRADRDALAVNGYAKRFGDQPVATTDDLNQLTTDLAGAHLVGANPAFDAQMLANLLGCEPWHYRHVDVTSAVMYLVGFPAPPSLRAAALELRRRGREIPSPDHTAAGDVATVRAIHRALLATYREAA